MLVKHPKTSLRKWIKRGALVAAVFEVAAFGVTYFGWSKINRDRETRKHLKENYPFILEVYYRTSELIDSTNQVRKVDEAYWKAISTPEVTLMEPSRFIKSLFWLTSLTGFGYILLLTTTPKEEQFKKVSNDYPGVDKFNKLTKQEQLLAVLEKASRSDKPIYRLSKEEIDKDIRK
ncbi:unnamed protein product [Ceutorhynchus assimilis]|uniref:Uncharacterized protein n=1 Tax=Ceutorhynchus assimilis TaxID=467358 RepID=A0A9N9MMD8_9CUCU|nr:unnamed protein product [Ceutorhynchus assimilis]